MDKSEKSSVCIVILIVAVSLSIVVMFFENQYEEAHINFGPVEETVSLDFQSVTRISGYYNICLAVNTSTPTTIDKLLINPEEVNGLNIYLNGIAVDMAKPLNYHLNSGDYVKVNFALPCTEYASNSRMGVTVFTSPHAMYYQQTVFP
jgi:hypothetical protein